MKITKAVFAIVAISSAAAGDAVNPGPTRGLRSKSVKSKSDKEAKCVAQGGECVGFAQGDCCTPDECDGFPPTTTFITCCVNGSCTCGCGR